MKRAALIWDSPLLFARLISDCGYQCDEVTPHLLAAPFFRGRFAFIVIPGGFGDSKYSRVLPALKALSPRFKRYASAGGAILLFGAVSPNQNVYQWLVPGINYHFGFFDAEIIANPSESLSSSSQDAKSSTAPLLPVEYSSTEQHNGSLNVYSCDGYLTYAEASMPYPIQVLATAVHPDTHANVAVFVRIECGSGVIFISTIHEYPIPTFFMRVTEGTSDTSF